MVPRRHFDECQYSFGASVGCAAIHPCPVCFLAPERGTLTRSGIPVIGLVKVLARDGIAFTAAEALHVRVRASLAQERARAAGRLRPSPWAGARLADWWSSPRGTPARWGLAAALPLAASLALAILVARPHETTDWSGQLVAGHVGSLLVNHLTDVKTSDRHTVKPWCAGKIDFSPPVIDLTARGFPLVGGRLDDLDSRVVAALIYMCRQHVINLFLWPGGAAKPAAMAREGYNVLGWQQAGLTFFAVSALKAVELKEFQDDFMERAPR